MNLNSANVAEPPSLDSHKRTLLIVDDEEGPRESLNIVFKSDYDILLADNGDKAIELVRHHHVDAAVLDIRMPGLSGVDVLRQIKNIEPDLEVVMLTAYETVDTVRQALRLGACDYLNKPFDVSAMRAAVANAMERRRLSERIHADIQRLDSLEEELKSNQVQFEASKSRGEIYASIIHDLNSPLTIISGLIELVKERLAHANRLEGEDLAAIQRDIMQLSRQVVSCINISRRYLSFLRASSNEACRVDVAQVLDDMQVLLREHPDLKGNRLQISPPVSRVVAEFNGTDLIQILLNLTINGLQCQPPPHTVRLHARLLKESQAVDAMDEPGVGLHLERLAGMTSILAVSVEDAGPGIPPETLARIFDGHRTTKPAGKGTGLGLAIVRRLVSTSRGAIRASSRVGSGTAFTLYLPVVPPAESVVASSSKSS
ncbi:MAG: hybrid sensor histidine kinase/response regulator [Verrucomicrobiota bacterium]